MYIEANLALKERKLDKTITLSRTPGRYQPDDRPLTFLRGL